MTPTALAAVQEVVAIFARAIVTNQINLPGVTATDEPPTVRAARTFYEAHLTPPDDAFGFVQVQRLPAEMGAGFLVVGYAVESRWGAFEIYDAAGVLQRAGVCIAAGVAWHDVAIVRQAMANVVAPVQLLTTTLPLEWLSMGPEARESVGGRFFITPPNITGEPPAYFGLHDSLTRQEHVCASLAEAQKLAATIVATPP